MNDIALSFLLTLPGFNSSELCPPVFIGIYGEHSELSCSGLYKCNILFSKSCWP